MKRRRKRSPNIFYEHDYIPVSKSIYEQERGYSSLLLFKELVGSITGLGFCPPLNPCRVNGIQCNSRSARYTPLARNMDKLLYEVENIFVVSQFLNKYREEYCRRVKDGECFLKVLNDIITNLLGSRIKNSEDKEVARSFLRAMFREIRDLIRDNEVDVVNHRAYLAFNNGPIIGYEMGCHGCISRELLRWLEEVILSTLASTFTKIIESSLIAEFGGQVFSVALRELEVTTIHGIRIEPDNIDSYLVIGNNTVGVVNEYDILGAIYLANLYLYRNKESAVNTTRRYYRKIMNKPGWIAVARYKRRIIPFIAINLGDDLPNTDMLDALVVITKILKRLKLPKRILSAYNDCSIDNRQQVRKGGFVLNIETGVEFLVSHGISTPEPLSEATVNNILSIMRKVEEEPNMYYNTRYVKETVVAVSKTLQDVKNIDDVIRLVTTCLLNKAS